MRLFEVRSFSLWPVFSPIISVRCFSLLAFLSNLVHIIRPELTIRLVGIIPFGDAAVVNLLVTQILTPIKVSAAFNSRIWVKGSWTLYPFLAILNIHTFAFLSITLLFVSCRPEEKIEQRIGPGEYKGQIPAFPMGKELGQVALEYVEVAADTLLLTIDSGADPALSVYSLKDFRKLAATGKRGKGPFEFITPKFEGRPFSVGDSSYVYISDFNAHILFRLNITQLLATGRNEWQLVADIHHEIAPGWFNIFPIDSMHFMGNSWSLQARNFKWNLLDRTVTFLPNVPVLASPVPRELIGPMYYSFAAFNRQTKVMVSAMQLFKRVDFFDYTGVLIKSYSFNDFENSQPELRQNGFPYPDGTYMHFARISSDSRFIYAMCEDRRVEIKRRPDLEYQLYVFDWGGNYLGRWRLQRYNIGFFSVSEKERKLYAVNYGPDMEEYPLLVYDLASVNPPMDFAAFFTSSRH